MIPARAPPPTSTGPHDRPVSCAVLDDTELPLELPAPPSPTTLQPNNPAPVVGRCAASSISAPSRTQRQCASPALISIYIDHPIPEYPRKNHETMRTFKVHRLRSVPRSQTPST